MSVLLEHQRRSLVMHPVELSANRNKKNVLRNEYDDFKHDVMNKQVIKMRNPKSRNMKRMKPPTPIYDPLPPQQQNKTDDEIKNIIMNKIKEKIKNYKKIPM